MESDVPDVLAPDLRVIFCGINPGRVSAAARAHFANPRNDFWRLLHDAGFTPRLFGPEEQFEMPRYGIGLTNAAFRTTPGSGDLRRGDFAGARERLERIVADLRPRAIAFVGKEAYRGVFGQRPQLGAQQPSLGDAGLFVLPSTSPANAAVPYVERLRLFEALREWLEPVPREAVRALVVDRERRILLVKFLDAMGQVWWATPGGGVEEEADHEALRRELGEELGLEQFEIGPQIWTREHVFAWFGRILRQRERIYLVHVDEHEPAPTIDLEAEGVYDVRWWTRDELHATHETLVPLTLARRVHELFEQGPPHAAIDVGI